MYTLIRSVPLRNLLSTQAPALFLSFVIAELFFKFHSFTLECLAFLVTWFVIDVVISSIRDFWLARRTAHT
jgi:antibiotic biosynthesis monooxygenase (ABM) superfamily enzyme